ncbi:TPA: PTS transporter subunit EIIC [Klebsiella pneumoniae]
MSKNYAALAQQIVAAIGGVDNVAAVTHCMTRLRFVVKDDEQVDSSTLKGLAGVLGVVRSDNQCQVIIGNTVSQAYREVVNLLPGDLRPAEPQGKAPLTLKRIGAGILDALIGTMSPLIPAIIGGSMVKLLAMILEMSGALPKGSPTLTLLALIGDGAFFFLPLMVAASAAVKFKTNMSLAIAIAGVLVHPGFIELMAKAAQGEHVEFAFIPVTAVKYTYTVIPALVMTWCLSYIERWVDRITPAVTKNFLKPMLIVLIAAASAILAGISEPALYGVAVRLKRPLIASLISGFICGAVAGIAGLASHSMAAPGLFTSVQFFDPANPMTIVWVFGVMALSVVLSFALTLILGFEDIPVEQAAADARARQARAQASHA